MLLYRRLLIAGTLTVFASAILPGCSPSKTAKSTQDGSSSRQVASAPGEGGAADAVVAKVQPGNGADAAAKANELGLVPVLEYHGVQAKESRWVRSVANFKRDLEWLWKHGYQSATLVDMLEGFPQIAPGKKPVVFTFDDARGDQFVASGVDAGGLAIPTPDSAVGLMVAFGKEHPDFGHRASFYLLPVFFEDDKTAGAKLKYLHSNGFELGNHSWSHLMIGKSQPAKIRDELAKLQAAVRKHLGPDGDSFRTRTLALPHGSEPKSPAQKAATVGGPGQAFHHEALLLVGANPAYSPFAKKHDPLRIARIQAIDDEWKRFFGRKNAQDMGGKETFDPYIADGNPQAVTFPVKMQAQLDKARTRGAVVRIWNSDAAAAENTVAVTETVADAATVAAPAAVADTATAAAGVADTAAAAAGVADTATAAAGVPDTATAAAGVHPGYNEPLPPGGKFVDGKIFHTVQKGQSFDKLFYSYTRFTDSYTGPELRDRIMKVNAFKHPWVSVGQTFEVPGVRQAPPRPKPIGVPATFEAKGIYCTSTTASFDRIFRLASALKAVGGNSVVFDVKDGPVAFEAKDPKVRSMSEWDHTVKDLPKLVERLHKMGIHVIARQVLFNDPVLAKKRPDLAIRSKATGKPWLEHGKLRWVDPSQPEVQDYNIRLAKELATSGVDEIQFDYVRFPAQGNTRDCKFSFDDTKFAKHDIITGFLKKAHDELKPYNVLISIDVYGVMAWQKNVDLKVTGQKLDDMAKYVDVISPMVYPSHFYGPFDGYSRPANEPYYFVAQGVERVRRMVGPHGPVIRPWLQAFPYMVSNFNPVYVSRQIQANRDGKGIGWLLWNAGNKYDIGFAGVGHWNKVAPKTPIVAVKVKGDTEAAAKKVVAKPESATNAPATTSN
jgi:peptidoglycan/xylan/chitin deacetylase (PgdA/CDA1 family)